MSLFANLEHADAIVRILGEQAVVSVEAFGHSIQVRLHHVEDAPRASDALGLNRQCLHDEAGREVGVAYTGNFRGAPVFLSAPPRD